MRHEEGRTSAEAACSKLQATVTTAPAALQRMKTDNLAPLPPSMQIRQSSMHRNLQGTSLLPSKSQMHAATKKAAATCSSDDSNGS